MSVDPAELHIVHYPHPILRRQAASVPQVNDEVRAVAERMLQLMHEARGVGLAAPQVALGWRLFVANPTGDRAEDRIYINPRIVDPSRQTQRAEEGCLSIPQVLGQITRPVSVGIEALDEHARPIRDRADDLLGRIWQHETDHLDGVLILQKMPPADLRANRRAIEALEAEYAARPAR
jgi:peptide deformylase